MKYTTFGRLIQKRLKRILIRPINLISKGWKVNTFLLKTSSPSLVAVFKSGFFFAKITGSPAKKLTKCQVFLRGRRIEGIFARGSRLAKLLTNGAKVRFIRNGIKPKRFYEVKVLKIEPLGIFKRADFVREPEWRSGC